MTKNYIVDQLMKIPEALFRALGVGAGAKGECVVGPG